jgi:four helix bundle protein
MFLTLNHQKLDVYSAAIRFLIECYKMTNTLPPEEKFGMISQIRRAALSVHLNISEGASRKSVAERKRFYEIARGSVIEIDGALDAANALGYLQSHDTKNLGDSFFNCFKLLSGLIGA